MGIDSFYSSTLVTCVIIVEKQPLAHLCQDSNVKSFEIQKQKKTYVGNIHLSIYHSLGTFRKNMQMLSLN